MFQSSPIIVYNKMKIAKTNAEKCMRFWDEVISNTESGTIDHRQAIQAWFAWVGEKLNAESEIEKLLSNYKKP